MYKQSRRLKSARLKLAVLAGVMLLAATGCSQVAQAPSLLNGQAQTSAAVAMPPWQAPERQEHPLVGTLYQVSSAQQVSARAVLAGLPAGSWLLLGEQHDHPDHHQLQLWVLQQLAAEQRLGAVAMEMLNTEQQAALDAQLTQGAQSSPEALNWPERGWPFANYQAQVRFALDHAVRVVAADYNDSEKTALRQNTGSVTEYSAEHTGYLAELIVKSHCGMFTAERARPAARMQIARDQQMARQMLANKQSNKVNVLIAGGQHVRKDIGVPLWLEEQPVLSILLVSVTESTNPQDYLPKALTADAPASAVADLIWFVPAIPAMDYCAQLKS
ncbi:hypothetical protein GCM10010919_22720 [Alishewanella longhuensis]|uniref:Haem-binding uptake Tiki superfamily ChaN domain-containing protein n=1 Tax=Alishewanella longhuensis TaxID=1091037 RepID=A0ABQ3KYY8_9ALTE|nr:ChaN family lipoprotein [Alishewanella longhuensis]GHG71447.1 hypothetical protein GCM10010919_22720 [Alishewanella longhuensis]